MEMLATPICCCFAGMPIKDGKESMSWDPFVLVFEVVGILMVRECG
jgi:hypothetical protein